MNRRPGSSVPPTLLEAALDVWAQTGRYHTIPIVGQSMYPLLRAGDRVRIEHGATDVRTGEIIVFRANDTLLAHRVLRIIPGGDETHVLTAGDNSTHPDAPVPSSRIVGRVIGVMRAGSYAALDTPTWRLVGRIIAMSSLGMKKLAAAQRSERDGSFAHLYQFLSHLLARGPYRVLTRSATTLLLRWT